MMGRIMAAAAMAALLPLSANAASADLSASYANFSHGGGDVWNLDGAVAQDFGGGWGGEIGAGYHHLSVAGGHDLGNAGGSVYWGDGDLRVAATADYLDLSFFHLATYGAGAEWYASPRWTLAARAAGASGQFNISGGYVGGDVKFYATPDLALNAGVDYINLSGFTHVTSQDIRAEWLVSETTPVSLFGGYVHADAGLGNWDVFFVGVKIYTDATPGALIDRQRSGNLGYIGSVPYLGQEL